MKHIHIIIIAIAVILSLIWTVYLSVSSVVEEDEPEDEFIMVENS